MNAWLHLSLLSLDTARVVWNQRAGLDCPDVEGLFKFGPGATSTIRGLVVSPRELRDTRSRARYQAVARLATLHYEPLVLSAGEIRVR